MPSKNKYKTFITQHRQQIAIIIIILSLSILWWQGSAMIQQYNTTRQQIEILTAKIQALENIDTKKLEQQVQTLKKVVQKAQYYYLDNTTPLFSLQSFIYRYVFSLLKYTKHTEYDNISISVPARHPLIKTWQSITISVTGIKGFKNMQDIIHFLEVLEKANKLIYIQTVAIDASNSSSYSLTVVFTLPIAPFLIK